MRKLFPATLGWYLSAAGAALGQEGPGPAPVEPGRLALQAISANQQLATTIAERLRHNAALKHYRVDVAATEGTVELTGRVADAGQRDEVLRTVQAVPGVACVRDRMMLAHDGGTQSSGVQHSSVQPIQATVAPPPPLLGPGGPMPPEPMPIFSANGGMPNPHMQPPPLPPNAWPTYAPYNNFSRVAYPTQYPYQAWPFIGPQYPFPKVPLGWRSVSLTWQDGHWWYGREASGHDWWRVRYW